MANNTQWKSELSAIIRANNDGHAVRDKEISFSTRSARRQGLFRIFSLLRRLGFQLSPRNLNSKHIKVLMAYWTAAPKGQSGLPPGNTRSDWPTSAYSSAYIQQQMSFLRVFASWIKKDGLVQAAEKYVADPALVQRCYCATDDKGWEHRGVDVQAKIEQVRAIDPYVGVQLQMMRAFGLRRKEAVMFSPVNAEVPAQAIPAGYSDGDRFLAFLRIKRGTKGGRLRYAAVRSAEQRAALEEAKLIAHGARGHIGRPGLTLKQSLDLFSNVVRQVGLTKKELGVTPHGLRHQFAGDLYFEISGLRPPVQGGEADVDHAAMEDAYRQVARQLGHNRPQISNAYLGSPCKKLTPAHNLLTEEDHG